MILVVVLASANSHPVPGLHGKALAVTLALIVFAAMLLIAIRDGFPERPLELQGAADRCDGRRWHRDRGAAAEGRHWGRGRGSGVHGDHAAAV